MNIELTKEQFRSLLDLVYAGNWMINSNRDADIVKKYSDLESYVFSKCGEFGFKEFMEDDGGTSYPSSRFDESGIMDYIDDYNEDTTLQELAERLSYRDVPHTLDDDEIGDYLEGKYEAYMHEFDENGFENISVDLEPKEDREIKL